MKRLIFTAAAAMSTIFAALMATSACWLWFYQPEEPKSLRED
ncbi:MAG: cyclic lactone autoinducer peptide [Eubacteriales bacterium]